MHTRFPSCLIYKISLLKHLLVSLQRSALLHIQLVLVVPPLRDVFLSEVGQESRFLDTNVWKTVSICV